MNNKTYHEILDSAANDSLGHQADLWPNISARLERKSLLQTMRTRPLVVVMTALFALLLLSGVAYALGHSLGYIPGIGIVDQSVPIRVLPEVVTVKQRGISVTVTKVVADSTRTFIAYRVDGIPFVENGIPACVSTPQLRLPDGVYLENKTGSGGAAVLKNGNTMYFDDETIFSPLPNGTKNVTLVLSCILPGTSGQENFELPLKLVPASADYATPVVEAAGTAEAAVTTVVTVPAEVTATADGVKHKSGLQLEKALELANSYILIGKFTDAGDLDGPLAMSTSSDSEYLPHIEDANGKPVSFQVREDVRPDPDWDVAYHWAYEIQKPVATPLKITVDHVNIRKHDTAQFQFDSGEQPQIKQTWKLNLPVKLGASEFVLDSVTFLGNGYTFNLTSDSLPKGVTPDIEIVDSALRPYQFENIDSTEDDSGSKAIYTITLTTKRIPPSGKLTVQWGLDEFIPQAGPWSLVWTPATTNP